MGKIIGQAGSTLGGATTLDEGAVAAGVMGEQAFEALINPWVESRSGATVYHSVQQPGTDYDIDHVVTYKGRLLVVDSKHWSGKYEYEVLSVDDGQLTVGRRKHGATTAFEPFLGGTVSTAWGTRRLYREGGWPDSFADRSFAIVLTAPGATVGRGSLSSKYLHNLGSFPHYAEWYFGTAKGQTKDADRAAARVVARWMNVADDYGYDYEHSSGALRLTVIFIAWLVLAFTPVGLGWATAIAVTAWLLFASRCVGKAKWVVLGIMLVPVALLALARFMFGNP